MLFLLLERHADQRNCNGGAGATTTTTTLFRESNAVATPSCIEKVEFENLEIG